MEYRKVIVEGIQVRQHILSGKYRCECGREIAKPETIPKHVQTKSHHSSMEWKQKMPDPNGLRFLGSK